MANEASDALASREALSIPTRDYVREFIGGQMSIVDSKIDMLQRLNEANAQSAQRAVTKAEEQMNERLKGMNEFRDQLKDQAATFVKIDQFAELKEQLADRTSKMETSMVSFTRKEDVDNTRTALGARTDEIRAVLQVRIETIEKTLANWQGRMVVFGAIWSIAVVVIGAFVNYAVRAASGPSATVSNQVEIAKAIENIQQQLNAIQKQPAPPQR